MEFYEKLVENVFFCPNVSQNALRVPFGSSITNIFFELPGDDNPMIEERIF